MLTAVVSVEGVGCQRIRAVSHPLDPPEGAYMATVDRCGQCGRPHRIELPCWRGSYCARITKTVLALMGTVCWVCGRDIATTADHIKPRGEGGSDALDNLRPACVSCNSRRAHHDNPFTEDAPVDAPPASRRWR